MVAYRQWKGIFRPPTVGGGGPAFTGLGDVVTLDHYYGMRAYASASIGLNAVELRESGGNTLQTFATISGGGLDLTAIATFKGANNLFVRTLFDQVSGGGSTINFIQTTNANQPPFLLSALNGLPGITADRTVPHFMTNAGSGSSVAASQPISLSSVIRREADGQFDVWWANNDAGNMRTAFGAAANGGYFDVNNTGPSFTVADGAEHAVNFLWNGASSVVRVNGTDTTGTVGASGIAGGNLQGLFRQNNGGFPLSGRLFEFGYGASAINRTTAETNQRAYYGI